MQYIKWREPASAEANKRAKTTQFPVLTHPFLDDESDSAAVNMIEQIKNYTPKGVSKFAVHFGCLLKIFNCSCMF